MVNPRILLLLLLPSLAATIRWEPKLKLPEFDEHNNTNLHISLTINALNNFLEVSWQNAPALLGDRIRLTYLGKNELPQTTYSISVLESSSSHMTNLKFDFTLPRNLTAQSRCYDYSATYEDAAKRVLAVTCVRAYPTWMQDLGAFVSGLRMRDIFVPGTHDAGAYLSALTLPLPFDYVANVSVTQDENIWSQLMHGVRYVDMRITHRANFPERFFIHHGVVPFATLRDVINQVKRFVLETKEVVIFGARFDGAKDYHASVVNFLTKEFKDLYVNATLTWNATLREIWDSQRYVILAYDHPDIVAQYPDKLFSPVKMRWGNVNTKDNLEAYLRSINNQDAERLSERPVADMAELTPTLLDVTLHRKDLRQMADEVNPLVSQLYRDELGENANIVAVDFLRGTNIVDIALEWNMRKYSFQGAFL